MPKMPDNLIRCVFYIYASEDDARKSHPDSATGFFFGIPSQYRKNSAYVYAVTNRHVIDRQDMEAPILRINTKDGSFDILETRKEDWSFHPLMSDLAICGLGLDSSKHDISFLNPDFLLTKEFVKEMNVGAGDDVFMIGNFQTRGGRTRNYPTVRFGNISENPNEPMRNPHTNFDEESFIVEMRSSSGYSGSPVILSISALFPRFNENVNPEEKIQTVTRNNMYDYYCLVGIDWGHIRTKERIYDKDGVLLPDRESVWINSAMAGVVPSWKLTEMLYSDEEIERRNKLEEKARKEIEQSEIALD